MRLKQGNNESHSIIVETAVEGCAKGKTLNEIANCEVLVGRNKVNIRCGEFLHSSNHRILVCECRLADALVSWEREDLGVLVDEG